MTLSKAQKSNREQYLREVAKDFGIPYFTVLEIAQTLGPSEDHDALVTLLEDYADEYDEYFDEWEFDDDE